MPTGFDGRLVGLKAAQRGHTKVIAAMRPTGPRGAAVKVMTTMAHRYASNITHVQTGTLRASHRLKIGGGSGIVYTAEHFRNIRDQTPVGEYGPKEEARGGSHAFYGRTVAEMGPTLLKKGAHHLLRSLPK